MSTPAQAPLASHRWALVLLMTLAAPWPTARAANDCGAPVMNAVTCTAPVMGQSFTDADGITYAAGASSLAITVNGGVTAEHVALNGTSAAAALSIDNSGTIEQTAVSTGTAIAGLYAAVQIGGTGPVSITNSGDITTSGAVVHGIFGDTVSGLLSIESSGSIETTGNSADGIFARSIAGQIEITAHGSIETQAVGTGAAPILVISDGGDVHITTDAALISHSTSNGIHLFSGAAGADVTLDMTGGSVTTENGDGIYIAAGVGSAHLMLAGSIMATNGGDAVYVNAIGGITVTLDGSASSALGQAINLNGAGGTTALTINAGGFATALGNLRTIALSGASGITFDNAGEVTNDNYFLSTEGATTLRNDGILRGSATLFGGDQKVQNRSGGLIDWSRLTGDAVFSFGDGTDLFDNQAGALLSLRSKTLGGDLFQMTGLETFRNAGRVSLADLETGGGGADPGDVLEISGAYVSAGGTLALDVTLGGDGSAADLLRVGSTVLAGGPTLIEVVNAGGLGAAAPTGIKLVEVTGASATKAFALAAPVSAGGFDYYLVRGADGDWYLTTNNPITTTPVKAFQASSLLVAWQQGLGPLSQRMSELRALFTSDVGQTAALGLADAGDPAPRTSSGLWLRGAGAHYDFDSSVGVAFEQQTTVLQAGYDLGFRDAFGGDLLLAGLAGTLTQSTAEAGGSSLELTGYGGALYATWLSGPLYLDAIAKADAFTVTQRDDDSRAHSNGWVAGLSLETGWRAELGGSLYLQPEAQLSYATGDLGDLTDALGRDVAFGQIDSLTTRLGLELGVSLAAGGGVVLRPQLSADWIHEFLGESEARAGGLTAVSDLGGSRWRLGGGLAVIDTGGGFQLSIGGAYEAGDSGDGLSVNATLRLPL